MSEREPDKARKLGRMVVREHTARRLVTEAQGRPLVIVGVVWAAFLAIAIPSAPWRGGTPLWIVLAAAAIAIGVSLLVMRFVPRRERLMVDVEAGEFHLERTYLLPRSERAVQALLTAVVGVRCRRRSWQEEAGTEAVRWMVELVGEGNATWPVAEWSAEEPMQELARLIAEVSSRPLI